MGRRYTLGRRAEHVDETRRRIVEAAMELHGTVGPAHTTISAVAERAGVQRLTVYRHFPDEAALFGACSGQWIADHPPPDISGWLAEPEPQTRLRRALLELYGYFGRTSPMWERVYRDRPVVPALEAPMTGWDEYLERARHALVDGWRVDRRRRGRLAIAIGHALAFPTWASLSGLGSDVESAADLMVALAAAAAHGPRGRPPRRAARPGRRPPRSI